MLNFRFVRGLNNLFTLQRSEVLAKYENENSYNDGMIFLKLRRDFPLSPQILLSAYNPQKSLNHRAKLTCFGIYFVYLQIINF